MTFVLTYKEEYWLKSHGGRDEDDVRFDKDNRKYVIMWDGRYGQKKEVRVYIKEHEEARS